MKKGKLVTMTLAAVLAAGTVLAGCGQSANNTGNNTGAANPNEGGANPGAAAPQVIELNLGHTLTADSERQVVATKLAELASQKSNGTIKITLFPQGQLGGEVKQIQSVRTGTQGMLFVSSAALENTVKEYFLFDLPYLFDSAEQADKILKGEVGDKLLALLEQHEMVGLGWAWPNERNVFANKAINTPEDLKGFKTRVIQAPGYVKTYEMLGAQPTPMGYSEVYLAVQQGVVDGADVPPDQYVMDKFSEVSKFYNKTKMHYVPIVVAISKLKWDAMTPDQQKALQEATDEALAFGVEYNKTYYDKYYEEMTKAGVQIVEPSLDAFKTATRPAYDEILKDVPNGQDWLKQIEDAKTNQ